MGEDNVGLNPNYFVSSTLYIPDFLINLLSGSQVTKQLNCKVTFFPILLCVAFKIFHLGR